MWNGEVDLARVCWVWCRKLRNNFFLVSRYDSITECTQIKTTSSTLLLNIQMNQSAKSQPRIKPTQSTRFLHCPTCLRVRGRRGLWEMPSERPAPTSPTIRPESLTAWPNMCSIFGSFLRGITKRSKLVMRRFVCLFDLEL